MLKDLRELRTLALILLCYLFWLLSLVYFHQIPIAFSCLILSLLMAFHSSLQHEILHGHPFKNQKLNEALVFLPIGVFVPFERFRDTHLEHHRDAILTDPYDDPETNYLDPAIWDNLPKWQQKLLYFNNTILGRVLVGPLISLAYFWRLDWRAVNAKNTKIRHAWRMHFLGLALLVIILISLNIPLLPYLIAAYFGLSWLKIRTYLEHRAFEQSAGRSVIIESRGPLAFLFLNNNFHAVHHAHPELPWYDLPKKYEGNKENYLQRNRGYVFRHYGEIIRQFAFHRKDEVAHPLYPWDKDE